MFCWNKIFFYLCIRFPKNDSDSEAGQTIFESIPYTFFKKDKQYIKYILVPVQ